MPVFQIACNRVARPCGCATWHELTGGTWITRQWLCHRHEEAP